MKPTLIKADQNPVIRAYGNEIQIHLGGAQNNGAFTLFTDTTPPGGGPPPHFHVVQDEWWFLLEGNAEFFDGAQWIPVATGGAVFMPKHSYHTFRNAGDTPLKQLTLTTPSGIEGFFKKSEMEFQKSSTPDMKRIFDIGEEHGILFPTIAPEAMAKRGQPTLAPVIVQPGQGRVLHAFGEKVELLFDSEQTGGGLALFLETTPPGGGPPPHYHDREDECFYVLEGCVSFFTEGQWTDAHPGDVVFAPRASVHTFKNNSDQPTKMLIQTTPSGFDKFFSEAAEEFARPGDPDMDRAMQIAERHGIHFVQG